MPTKDYKNKKLNKEEARRLVIKLAASGRVILSNHARERLAERNIILNDVMNVLLSSSMRVSEVDFDKHGFTYRCSTKRFTVVVGFTARGDGLAVVTVFKTERIS